jgi:hypothetical protein
LFPALLPWLPTPNFSTKGFILGFGIAVPFVVYRLAQVSGIGRWQRVGWSLVFLSVMPALTAFFALQFTGSTVFTSVSGVRREIFRYFPRMAWMFGVGVVFLLFVFIVRWTGVLG